jgi:uncharacterized protein YeaO (DUF488 family)
MRRRYTKNGRAGAGRSACRRPPGTLLSRALKYNCPQAAYRTLPHSPEGHMSVRVVRLGTPRQPGEGVRIGTVRRPPRGVPKAEFAAQGWYDVWFPNLAPSVATMKLGQPAATPAQWAAFTKAYRNEMSAPDARHDLDLLAALSRTADFSVGCYCEHEERCHRSILRQLLVEHGATFAGAPTPP